MRRRLSASLVWACCCALASTELPLELAVHVPVARFSVQGRTANLIVDTGAGLTVLDSEFAHSLGLTGGKSAKIAGAGRTLEVRTLDRLSVSLPNQQAVDVPAVVLSLEGLSRQMGRRVDGVLGGHFLRQYVVEFDYQAGRVLFHPRGAFRPGPEWDVLPVRVQDERPVIKAALSGGGDRNWTPEFLLDTGSNYGLTLLPKFAERQGLNASATPTLDDPGFGVGGASPAVLCRMTSFRMGKYRFTHPYVRVRQEGKGDAGGLIGGAVLRQFRFAIDYPGKRLYLAASDRFGGPIEVDLAGLRVVWEGADFDQPRILEVYAGRAAARAGLRAGDVIEMPGLRPNRLAELVRQPGSVLTLSVRRGEERLQVDLRLEPLLPPSRSR